MGRLEKQWLLNTPTAKGQYSRDYPSLGCESEANELSSLKIFFFFNSLRSVSALSSPLRVVIGGIFYSLYFPSWFCFVLFFRILSILFYSHCYPVLRPESFEHGIFHCLVSTTLFIMSSTNTDMWECEKWCVSGSFFWSFAFYHIHILLKLSPMDWRLKKKKPKSTSLFIKSSKSCFQQTFQAQSSSF